MSVAEISRMIEEKAAERTRCARKVWGAPPHIAVAVERRIAEVNLEIRALQVLLYHETQSQLSHPSPS